MRSFKRPSAARTRRSAGWRLLASTAARGDTWTVTLPQELGLLHVDVNAGRGNIVLPGATLEGVVVTSNVGDVLLDLSTARVGEDSPPALSLGSR